MLLVYQSLSLHTGHLFTHGNLQNQGHDGWESFAPAANLKFKGLLSDKTQKTAPSPQKNKKQKT
jgi:hypothetical protein